MADDRPPKRPLALSNFMNERPSKRPSAACSTRWLEGRDKIVRLPEVEPDTFQLYLDWAYTDALAVEVVQESTMPKLTSCRGIVDLYLLGDILNDVKLRNKAMQVLSTHVILHWPPNPSTVSHIWANTTTTSLLRKWTVDITILRPSRDYFVEHAAEYPVDLVLQVATKLLQQTKHLNGKELRERLLSPDYFEPEGDALVPGT